MKSTIAATAVAILTSTGFAAKFKAGTLCHSNRECEANCVNGQFTFALQDGGSVFVCDPAVNDPTQWYTMACAHSEQDGVFQQIVTDNDITSSACTDVGGQICNYSCVVGGKRSADEDLRAKWREGCGKKNNPEIFVESTEESAKVYCKSR